MVVEVEGRLTFSLPTLLVNMELELGKEGHVDLVDKQFSFALHVDFGTNTVGKQKIKTIFATLSLSYVCVCIYIYMYVYYPHLHIHSFL